MWFFSCQKTENSDVLNTALLKKQYTIKFNDDKGEEVNFYAYKPEEAFDEGWKLMATKYKVDKFLLSKGVQPTKEKPTDFSVYENGNAIRIDTNQEQQLKQKWERVAKVKIP